MIERDLAVELEDLREDLRTARTALRISERAGPEGRVTDEAVWLAGLQRKRARVATLETEELRLVRDIETAAEGGDK